MIETKIVHKFGNSGHVVLPKGYIGKRIRFIVEPKSFEDIKSEVLGILKPYLENILGIYLYGSYARGEQTADSDIDILVINNNKLRIIDRMNEYSIISVTIKELESALNNNAVLVLPIIKEAKIIINPGLLEKYKGYKFKNKNTRWFINNTMRALELNKKGLELNFEIGSMVYSLMLRIRGLLMIKIMLNNTLYSKAALFSYLEGSEFAQNKIKEFYKIYSRERIGIRVFESEIITKDDISKLLFIAKNLLKEVQDLLR